MWQWKWDGPVILERQPWSFEDPFKKIWKCRWWQKETVVKVSSRSSKKSANICFFYCHRIPGFWARGVYFCVKYCLGYTSGSVKLAAWQMFYSCYCNEELDSIKCTSLELLATAWVLCRRQLRPQPSPPLSRDWRRRRRFRCLLPHPYYYRFCCTLLLPPDLLGDTAAFTTRFFFFFSTSKASIEVVPHNDQHTLLIPGR